MSVYNLKKSAKVVIRPYEKMNESRNAEMDVKPPDNMITEKQLADNHNPIDNIITEKQLGEQDKTASTDVILEKQMNKGTGSGFKHRRDDAIPVFEMYKQFEQEYQKKYKEANDKDKLDTMFWDKYVGVQLDADQITKITGNGQHSQLVSNYSSREEFLKSNPEIAKKAIKQASIDTLQDADALIYHVYRTVTEEGREELNEKEKNIVNDINGSKIRIIQNLSSK